jgi:hypothetical protein
MREHHEPGYEKINDMLGKSPVEINSRHANMQSMIKQYMDFATIESVMDFGGDEGQFIPPCFDHALRYVYEKSVKTPRQGITRISLLNPTASWDFVMASHVLEHAPWPSTMVDLLANHANKFIYFEVPFEREGSTPHYAECFHEHITKFDERSLKILLQTSGLKILEITTMEMESILGKSKNIMALCTVENINNQ